MSNQDILSTQIENFLNETAVSYGYESIINAISYAAEPAVQKFQLEGIAFRQWRSLVWESYYNFINEQAINNVDIESININDIIAQLPELVVTI